MYRFGLPKGQLWKSVIGKNIKEIKDFYSQRCFAFLVTNLHPHQSDNPLITPVSTHRHFLNSFLSQVELNHYVYTLEMSSACISRLLCRKATPFSVPTKSKWQQLHSAIIECFTCSNFSPIIVIICIYVIRAPLSTYSEDQMRQNFT